MARSKETPAEQAQPEQVTEPGQPDQAPDPDEVSEPQPAEIKAEDEEEARKTASTGLASDAEAPDEAGDTQRAVKEAIQIAEEKGYMGIKADPTPNENYTLQGVTDPNKHVPEEFKTQTGVTVYPDVHEDAKK